jgi:hypothetical protein
MGKPVYRQAQRLLITADLGGSNGSRVLECGGCEGRSAPSLYCWYVWN